MDIHLFLPVLPDMEEITINRDVLTRDVVSILDREPKEEDIPEGGTAT